MSGVIFLTNGETQNYKDLEIELLAQHRCNRIQPVATPPGHDPSWDRTWCGIASRLKKENCLVYVIWSGSLETTNGNHNPPIRKVIQSLDRPLRKNTPSKESVNHRLVLLQLGSKGTVDQLATDLYTKVFWDVSAEDPSFDVKKCGRHVYNVVSSVLRENEQPVKNNESKKLVKGEKSFIDGVAPSALIVGEGKPPPKERTSDDKPVTEGQLKETVKTIITTLNENKEEVIKHVYSVGRQVEYVAEKVDDQSIMSGEEFQDGVDESQSLRQVMSDKQLA